MPNNLNAILNKLAEYSPVVTHSASSPFTKRCQWVMRASILCLSITLSILIALIFIYALFDIQDFEHAQFVIRLLSSISYISFLLSGLMFIAPDIPPFLRYLKESYKGKEFAYLVRGSQALIQREEPYVQALVNSFKLDELKYAAQWLGWLIERRERRIAFFLGNRVALISSLTLLTAFVSWQGGITAIFMNMVRGLSQGNFAPVIIFLAFAALIGLCIGAASLLREAHRLKYWLGLVELAICKKENNQTNEEPK